MNDGMKWMITCLEHPARPGSNARFPVKSSLPLSMEQKMAFCDICLCQNPQQITVIVSTTQEAACLIHPVKPLARDLERGRNSVFQYVLLCHHSPPSPLCCFYPQGSWHLGFHQGQDGAAMGLSLVSKPHCKGRMCQEPLEDCPWGPPKISIQGKL